MRIPVPVRVAVVFAIAASLVAGCSSSKSNTPAASGGNSAPASSAGGASSAAAPTGSEVKIMIMAVKNNPVLAQEEQFQAAQARVDAINASGGLNGHKLTLIQCDTNLDPNQEQACLNTAVSDNVSAIVGSTILFSTFTNLEKAQIPLIGDQGITPSQLTSVISYPFAGVYGWFGGMVQLAKADGIKTGAVDYLATASAQFSDKIVTDAAPGAGIKIIANVGSALTTTDYTADAATLIKGKPDGVFVIGSTGTAPELIKSLKDAGYTGKIYSLSADFTQQSLKTMGSDGDGVRIAGIATPLSDSSDPMVQAYKADMQKYAPDATQDENGELGWSGVYVYAEVMKNATSFAGSDVISAFNNLTTPVTAGCFGPFVGAGTSPLSAFPRLFNHNYIGGTIMNGVIQASGTFTSAV